MLDTARIHRPWDPMPEPFAAVEFELALDLQDPVGTPFDACVRNAAGAVGGEMLFDMPADGTMEDASRIAAVRIAGDDRVGHIVFAVLDEAGQTIRIALRSEIGDRFHGFARAFVGVLERLRGDPAFDGVRPAGSA